MNTLLTSLANANRDIEEQVNALSINTVLIATLILVVLLAVSAVVVKGNKHKKLKLPLFVLISITIAIPSFLMIGSTVYVNLISESKGPVHWHTDIEFWVCDQEIELRDPYKFLSNKIGTSTYHEHDDKRIHLEGVVIEKEYDASLEKFMDVIEGSISPTDLVIPTDDDLFENDTDGDQATGDQELVRNFLTRNDEGRAEITVSNGMDCGDGQAAEVQAFLLRYNDGEDSYTQTKLEDPRRYIMRDESIVPPGDCVIVEFNTPREASERLCQQYGVRDVERCTEFGVSEFNPELCNLRQIVETGGTN